MSEHHVGVDLAKGKDSTVLIAGESSKNRYLIGDLVKCWACNGRGYTESENHPDCPACSGYGYIQNKEEQPNE